MLVVDTLLLKVRESRAEPPDFTPHQSMGIQTNLQTSIDELVTTHSEMDLTNKKGVEDGLVQHGKHIGSI